MGQNCNLRCDYCHIFDNEWPQINSEINGKIFKYIANNNVESIIFENAEPLLYIDTIKKIVETLPKNKYSISICTNGLLLNKNNISFFNEYNIKIIVSWDGHIKSKENRHYDVFLKNKDILEIKNLNIHGVIENIDSLKMFIDDVLKISRDNNKIINFDFSLLDEQKGNFGTTEKITKYINTFNCMLLDVYKNQNPDCDANTKTLLNFISTTLHKLNNNKDIETVVMSPYGEFYDVIRNNDNKKTLIKYATIDDVNKYKLRAEKATNICNACIYNNLCCGIRTGTKNVKKHCDLRKMIYGKIQDFFTDVLLKMCNNELAVFFEITNRCNHKCIHCCKEWEDNEIKRDTNIDVLNKIISISKTHLTISGGEPAIVKKLIKYLIDKESSPLTINTNLTLWNEQDIDFFNTNKIDLNVSVVSLVKDNYIEITGADTFDKFIYNLNKISRNNTISFIVNELSLPYIEYNTKILLLMGFHNILVSPQTPTPSTSVDIKKVINRVIKLHDKYKHIASITTQGCIGTEYCDHECEAGIKRILIDTKGDIYPCAPIHRECLLGNINDADFDINAIKRKGIDFYNSYPNNLQKVCKGFIFGEKYANKK